MARKKKKTTAAKKVTAEIITDDSIRVEPVKAEIVSDSKKVKKDITKLPALTDGLSAYLQTIQKYPLLTKDEELKIATRYKEDGDPEDAEILVTSNLRFVVKVAAEYSKFGSKLIDLIQEGNVGLMHAVKEFNPYKGTRLITYAVWWIRGYIQDYLMKQHSMVRIGTTHSQRKLFYNLEKEKAAIDKLGMEPTVKLLSDRLGVSEKDVRMMEQRMARKDLSLDQPLTADQSGKLLDLETSEDPDIDDQLIEKESIRHLQSAISNLKENLSEKELYILEKRLLSDEPMKLQEIGTEWGVTREAVRQMEGRLMKKIKKEMLPETN